MQSWFDKLKMWWRGLWWDPMEGKGSNLNWDEMNTPEFRLFMMEMDQFQNERSGFFC